MKQVLFALLLLLLPAGMTGDTSLTCATGATILTTTNSTTSSSSSLDADIGAMLLVGFRGTSVSDTSHIARDISRYHVGSVILFDYDAPSGRRGRNITGPDQLRALCRQLRQLSPALLIGVDQEGGRVARLRPAYGFPAFTSARQSAAQGPDSVRAVARRTAAALADVGVNLNFAPVADVDINPDCPVIGRLERSFSPLPSQVTACCRLWIEEQRAAGVGSCLKHFPGHGSASGDTHLGLVDVSRSWQPKELTPYRDLAPDSLLMVMTAHVINRRIDPSGLPASLSPTITSLLRDSLGFSGVIVTDDLAMGAIADHYTLAETIRLALVAGADLLCLSNNGKTYDPDLVPRVVAIVRRLVADGEVSADRIHTSAERVRRLARHHSASLGKQ